ncbi:hypothetical protein ACFQZI_20080 [Mucilaginibacter lutimaris]|uniref:G/U mismatch-specific uracil-DNA glycosylase n=1 Tax=Mucilaginibacter lutimaris TaxID=931629 RepID=A0ABW2ZLS9_9SPHI
MPRTYHTNASSEPEDLPWPEHIPKKADKLILGTFPTRKKNRAFDFFYPNPSNRFWEVLSEVAGHKIKHMNDSPDTVEERKRILNKLRLGITDMGATVLRHKESSADSALFPVEFTDIFKILTENPKINTLIVTSSSDGNSVFSWLRAYCALNHINIQKPKKEDVLPWSRIIPWDVRPIKIICVCSPSKRVTRPVQELIEMYREAIKLNLP